MATFFKCPTCQAQCGSLGEAGAHCSGGAPAAYGQPAMVYEGAPVAYGAPGTYGQPTLVYEGAPGAYGQQPAQYITYAAAPQPSGEPYTFTAGPQPYGQPMPPVYQGAPQPLMPEAVAPFPFSVAPPAELPMMECMLALGSDVSMLPSDAKAVPLLVGAPVEVGRSHQAGLFERLLQMQPQWLGFISRSHFRARLAEGGEASVENLSANVLLVNGQPLAQGQVAPMAPGSTLSFVAAPEGAVNTTFLEFVFRGGAGGPGPAMGAPPAVAQAAGVQADPATRPLLECMLALGADVSQLPMEQKAVSLQWEVPVEVGRSHQVGLFETLLNRNEWLPFISRSHFRVLFQCGQDGQPAVSVENLSANVLLVSGAPLGQGRVAPMVAGSTLSFVAAPDGGAQTTFLEFVLRF